MLGRLILAVLIGVAVWLMLCMFLGGVLIMLEAPPAVFVGNFLMKHAMVISVLAALWYFFTGGGSTFNLPAWKNPSPPAPQQ